jgi:hypothetical protein
VGIDERGWRALETLAREINARSPEAAAREVSKRAVEVAKAAGIFALDRLVSRLAGRRVDTAPRALPTDGAWVRRAIVGGPASPETPRARASERPAPSPAGSTAANTPSQRVQEALTDANTPSQRVQEALTDANTPSQGTQEALTDANTPSQGRQEALTDANTPSQGRQEALTDANTPSQGRQEALADANTPSQGRQEPLGPVATPSDGTQSAPLADNTASVAIQEAVAQVYPVAVEAPEVAPPAPAESPSVEAPVEATAAPVEPAIVEPVAVEAPAAEPVAAEPAPSLRPTDAPADLQVPRTDEPLPALPARYGIDRVVMLAAESEWVFVYWETAPARLGRTNRAELRLLTEAGALVGRAYVDPVQGRQHLRVPARGQRYTAELVLLDGTVLSRSRPVLVRAPEST